MSTPTTRYRVQQVTLSIDRDPAQHLAAAVADAVGVARGALDDLSVIRRTLDVRGKRPRYTYVVDFSVPDGTRLRRLEQVKPAPQAPPRQVHRLSQAARQRRVAVVGAGPGGLFAALTLAEAGLRPVLFERGKIVEERAADVAALFSHGRVDPESNICFGEGGAGTWSDGKLTTRIDAGEARWVLERLVEAGAPREILVEGKPHLGTDRLDGILRALRRILQAAGVALHFQSPVRELLCDAGRATALCTADGQRHPFDTIVMAPGHSARDLYAALHRAGVALAAKAFAVGLRVEHPQALINAIQYGPFATDPRLPPADYRLAMRTPTDRAVYSFCMCPGGVVVPATTAPDAVVVNGMSDADRSGPWANAAMVTAVDTSDFAPFGDDPLAGLRFQQDLEARAAAAGGGHTHAPAQGLLDFIARRASTRLRPTTYRPGTTAAALHAVLPPHLVDSLICGLQHFDRPMRGFLTQEAVLIGVESRTSAPVRILRDPTTFASVSTPGLYPVGEGAGYAGGIVSAAVDGIKAANAILSAMSA